MKTTDIGSRLKTVLGITPDNPAAGTVDGTGIDRQGFLSLVVAILTGAQSGGTPTAAYKVQHSADDTTYTDYLDLDGNAYEVTGLGADQVAELDVPLMRAQQYIRVEEVVTGAGNIQTAAAIILGGSDTNPPA